MGARGPKPLTAAQLKARGANPQVIARRQREERATRRPFGLAAVAQREIPSCPEGLKGEGRAFFLKIATGYFLEAAFVDILVSAAWAKQQEEDARILIERDGLVVKDDRGKPIQNPAAVISRQSATLFARLVKQLNLPED